MQTAYFVEEGSIVRKIWGKSDTILFIFAGAAAEFALNKAVDWLYFTGRLPSRPLERLFSTVSYAKSIVFSEKQKALQAIDTITAIHAKVENDRGKPIPSEAYRDVLFMLIDYSVRSFELLERTLTPDEKAEVFNVFNRVGIRMKLKGLPGSFTEWEQMRLSHLDNNMVKSAFTLDLFRQYKKHLGTLRYKILLEAQAQVVPQRVRLLLGFRKPSVPFPLIPLYKASKNLKIDRLLKSLILPAAYQKEIRALDHTS